MSVLREGDEDMHYSDGSHRWIAPPGTEQGLWEVGVRAHLSRHMATMGGPVPPDRLWACRPARPRTAFEAADPVPVGTVSRLRSSADEPVRREEPDPLPGAA